MFSAATSAVLTKLFDVCCSVKKYTEANAREPSRIAAAKRYAPRPLAMNWNYCATIYDCAVEIVCEPPQSSHSSSYGFVAAEIGGVPDYWQKLLELFEAKASEETLIKWYEGLKWYK